VRDSRIGENVWKHPVPTITIDSRVLQTFFSLDILPIEPLGNKNLLLMTSSTKLHPSRFSQFSNQTQSKQPFDKIPTPDAKLSNRLNPSLQNERDNNVKVKDKEYGLGNGKSETS
jgi:hypothetical protein